MTWPDYSYGNQEILNQEARGKENRSQETLQQEERPAAAPQVQYQRRDWSPY